MGWSSVNNQWKTGVNQRPSHHIRMNSRRRQIDFSEKLVAEVEKVPMIYNQNDPDYKVKSKTDIAWTHIAAVMESTVDMCKSKWGNLRGTYSKHLTAALQDPSKAPIWYLYQQMGFLEPYMQHTNSQNYCVSSQAASQQNFVEDNHSSRSSPLRDESPTSFPPVKFELPAYGEVSWISAPEPPSGNLQSRSDNPTPIGWPVVSQLQSRRRNSSTPPVSEQSSGADTPTPPVHVLGHASENGRTTSSHQSRKRPFRESDLTGLEAAAVSYLARKGQEPAVEENPNLTFLKGLLPIMAQFNSRNLRKYQRQVFNLAHDMLDDQEKEQDTFL